MAALQFDEVDKSFGAQQVLHGVSFSVAAGEIVGLLGPNGSGKTTTLRLAAGFYTPDRGAVRGGDGVGVVSRNGGTSLPPLSAQAMRQRVGYLPERTPLYDALTVEQYLDFVARAKGLRRATLRAAVERSLTAFDLQGVRRTATSRLSKGFRQRVGLGQAILGEPEVLLLDEATNGLDPIQIVEARQMIRHAADGRAVVFSSHLMQEVQALCTRAVILRHGRVIADVPVSQQMLASGQAVVDLRWRAAEPGNAPALAALVADITALGATVIHAPPQDRRTDASHDLACRFDTAPSTLDDLLRVALAHGSVIEARHRVSSIEELLVNAVQASDAQRAGQPGAQP